MLKRAVTSHWGELPVSVSLQLLTLCLHENSLSDWAHHTESQMSQSSPQSWNHNTRRLHSKHNHSFGCRVSPWGGALSHKHIHTAESCLCVQVMVWTVCLPDWQQLLVWFSTVLIHSFNGRNTDFTFHLNDFKVHAKTLWQHLVFVVDRLVPAVCVRWRGCSVVSVQQRSA